MLVKVKVKAGIKKEALIKKGEDSFSISVKEDAKQGEANKRVVEILARHFNTPKNKIRLIKGHTTPSKIFEIRE